MSGDNYSHNIKDGQHKHRRGLSQTVGNQVKEATLESIWDRIK